MMKVQPLDRIAILQVALLITCLILLSGGLGLFVLTDPAIEQTRHMFFAALTIESQYHIEVDRDQMVQSARRGMIGRLDRYSGFVTAEEFDEMKNQRSGSYGGIGATVSGRDDGLVIMSLTENGPADESGLLDGDLVIRADTFSLVGLSAREATGYLRGEEGSVVALDIIRPGSDDTLSFSVIRRRIPYGHVVFAGYGPDSCLYIRLDDFNPGASQAVEWAVDSLLSENVSGFVLDLRGNPGGLYTEAVETAELFLDEGTFVVGTEGKSRWTRAEDRASRYDITHGLPMVVLVDGNSASASEIVAGALQQAQRAVLIGDTTYGKGLVQGFVRVPGQDGLRLTVSRYYLDGKLFLNDFDSTLNEIGRGLAPDLYYSFQGDDEFPRQIERSLLLQSFVYQRQDQLLEDGRDGVLNIEWPREFYHFARKEEFTFNSTIGRKVNLLAELAENGDHRSEVKEVIDQLRQVSEQEGLTHFYEYGDYIANRLWQLSLQRCYSVAEAYRQAVVPNRPEIAYAAHILDSLRNE